MKRLTKDDITEIVGSGDLSNLRELEILFQQCDELGSLHHCPNLQRLSVIDTGLKRMSNLSLLGPTLVTLCICDQDIAKIENLDLPNLKELFLHRNQISVIEGLERCPRLRRLWLFQNQITAITGLHALPELEECWLQGNRISSLHGIENVGTLVSLALGGNLVSEYNELHRLAALPRLSSLALQDVHFGRCPIVDDTGYRNFCVCYLPQLTFLDGVQISADHQKLAFLSHAAEVGSYNERIAVVENIIKCEIDNVQTKQQASKSHLLVLERELADALRELEELISEGRNSMSKQVKKQKKLMEASFKVLEKNIGQEKTKVQSSLNAALANINTEHDITEALFCVLERVSSAELGLLDVFSNCSTEHPKGGRAMFVYQSIADSSPDFLRMASLLPLNHRFSGVPSAVLLRHYRTGNFIASDSSPNDLMSNRNIIGTAVPSGSRKCDERSECYTVLSLEQLQNLLSVGLEIERSGPIIANESKPSVVFFTDIAVAISLFLSSVGSAERACFGEFESTTVPNLLDEESTQGEALLNMPSFKAARNTKLMLLVSCELDTSLLNIGGDALHRIRLPASTSARQEMYADLRRAKKPVAFEIEIPIVKDESPPISNIYTVPEVLCCQDFFARNTFGADDRRVVPVHIKFISICLSPLVDGVVGIGGMKALENKLELLLMPPDEVTISQQVSPGSLRFGSPNSRSGGAEAAETRQGILTNSIFRDFNSYVSAEVRDYLDRVMEEVTAETADTLRSADMDVESRSAAIRALRNQIEEERRAQEALLKKMKMGDDRSNNGPHGYTSASRSAGATQRERGSSYRR